MPISKQAPAEPRSARSAKTRRAAVSRPAARTAPAWAMRPVRWLQTFLKRRLRLERRGFQLHVLLDPAPAIEATPAVGGEALRRAHDELRKLLDRHADTRHMLRHLGYIERTIAQTGSRAFRQIPAPVLRKGLEQLDMLARDTSAEGLAPLRARLEAVLQGRPGDAGESTRPQAVHVSEASHSLFDEMERSWTGQVPLDELAEPDKRRA